MNVKRLLLAALLVGRAAAALAALHTVAIYHTSDVHGQFASRPARWNKADPERKVGGYAALAALLSKETTPYLLLDSGDIFQGTPEGNLTRGDASIALMNALGYKAMAVGNHEYDYGEPNLERLAGEAKFPFLGANIYRKADGERVAYAKPTARFEIGGVSFGVVGLATRKTSHSTLPANVKHLRFADEASEARGFAEHLRRDGAEVVIALTHCGLAESLATRLVDPSTFVPTAADLRYRGDLAIARAAPVDLVLGGHLHTGLLRPWKDPVSGVTIAQSFVGLTVVTRLELTYDDEAKKIVSLDGRLIDLWVDQNGEDPKVAALIKEYSDKVGAALDKPAGEAAADMPRFDQGLDSPIGDWMTDVMRAAASADIAIQNSFGIRADLRRGPVTLRQIYEVMPFDNTLVIVSMKGSEVERLIRDNLLGARTAMQVSGLRVSYRLGADKDRPLWVKIAKDGRALDARKTYKVATNNYLAGGGSGAQAMRKARKTDTGRNVRDLLIEDFKLHSPVQPPPTGRFELLP